MRKLLLALLLPFVLLLSQQGAMTHEIGHIAGFVEFAGGTTTTGVPARTSHRADDVQCAACLAFAHLAGIATIAIAAPLLASLDFHFFSGDAPAFVAADAPTARSRGPPLFL